MPAEAPPLFMPTRSRNSDDVAPHGEHHGSKPSAASPSSRASAPRGASPRSERGSPPRARRARTDAASGSPEQSALPVEAPLHAREAVASAPSVAQVLAVEPADASRVDAPSLAEPGPREAGPTGRTRRVRRTGRSSPGALARELPPIPFEHEPERHAEGPPPSRHRVEFPANAIDPDVARIVTRLTRHGYEAYLVGGCVRDLLLGRQPKDFDVATSARPEEVRDLFRNSRVIGRRFRLVHVVVGQGHFIEVATFRRNPNEGLGPSESDGDTEADLLIRSDNAFGEAWEDAARRDFTMNALFYDLASREVLDWVGGMSDVERRVVQTIGAPEVRFREDPIRMLRALKFAGRLELAIAPEVYDAIVVHRDELSRAAKPRLSEEILRLLRGGQARRTIYLAWETGVLDVLLPELSAILYDGVGDTAPRTEVFRVLSALDARVAQGPLDDIALWAALLLLPLEEACEGARDRGNAAAELFDPIAQRLAIPRRVADGVRRIFALLPRIRAGKTGRLARGEAFELASEVAALGRPRSPSPAG
jgi:poly(A) polymerase